MNRRRPRSSPTRRAGAFCGDPITRVEHTENILTGW